MIRIINSTTNYFCSVNFFDHKRLCNFTSWYKPLDKVTIDRTINENSYRWFMIKWRSITIMWRSIFSLIRLFCLCFFFWKLILSRNTAYTTYIITYRNILLRSSELYVFYFLIFPHHRSMLRLLPSQKKM